jgi:hypothetical protein
VSSQAASAASATPMITSNVGRDTRLATTTPRIDPGSVQAAKMIPER